MNVKTLIKKGTDHLVFCEDDLFFREETQKNGDSLYIAAVFDGCSTGYKSHFASSLFGKILKDVLNTNNDLIIKQYDLELIANLIFYNFFRKLKEISTILNLIDLELVSTFIISIVRNDEAFVIISGDGCIMIDDNCIKIESQDNAPDYLAYHLNENPSSVYNKNVKKYSFKNINKGFSICSDGIFSFRKINNSNVEDYVIDYLLKDKNLINSDAMLARKYNILVKDGYINYDDLSIVRFII
jgi:serine/threonine protein phosphatase PrpC